MQFTATIMRMSFKISASHIRHYVIQLCLFAAIFSITGCATPVHPTPDRRFDFATDTFSYNNELVREYFFDEHGKWESRRREPPPTYTLHCFPVVRAAKQFFIRAEFHPEQPVADEKTYRRLINQIIFSGLSGEKIIVPGYANLREFSRAQEKILKQECGGIWRSYFQRGNWRMVFPFPRRHQEMTSEELIGSIGTNGITVVHLIRFPQLSINHAVALFDFQKTAKEIRFSVYDPNMSEAPTVLTYDRASRTFFLPSNPAFYGGKVNVYEIYHSCLY